MFETLVSSKIRRALLEHILTHPSDRFYLRGLAKALGLSISPLRRELKRFEQSGLLNTLQEGSILFYTVNTDSPIFRQLRQTEAPSHSVVAPAGAEGGKRLSADELAELLQFAAEVSTQRRLPAESSPAPAAAASAVAVQAQGSRLKAQGTSSFEPRASSLEHPLTWHSSLSSPALIGAAGIGLAMVLLIVGLLYLNATHQQLVSQATRSLAAPKPEVTVVVPQSSTSGTMRGQRWQLIPGGFGGFSSGGSSSQQSY